MQWAIWARQQALTLRDALPSGSEDTAEITELLLRAASAEEVVWAMDAYRKGQPLNSSEDDARSARAHTFDNVGSSAAEAKLVRHSKQRRCEERIDNCVAVLAEVQERLRELELLPAALALSNLLPTLKRISSEVAPMRHRPPAP